MARDNKRKADVFYHDRLAGLLEEKDAESLLPKDLAEAFDK